MHVRSGQRCRRTGQNAGAVVHRRHDAPVRSRRTSPGPGSRRSSRQTSAALATTRPEDRTARSGRHPDAEAVLLRPTTIVGLEGPLHGLPRPLDPRTHSASRPMHRRRRAPTREYVRAPEARNLRRVSLECRRPVRQPEPPRSCTTGEAVVVCSPLGSNGASYRSTGEPLELSTGGTDRARSTCCSSTPVGGPVEPS